MVLTHVPHPLLKKTAKSIPPADLKSGKFAQLMVRMRAEMIEHHGVGLAANQVGHDDALFIIDEKLASEYAVPSVFANPEITEYGKETDIIEEGCLSLPGVWIHISRSKKIMFKALDSDGNKVKFRARGMLARVLQHETDHLNGLTIRQRTGTQS